MSDPVIGRIARHVQRSRGKGGTSMFKTTETVDLHSMLANARARCFYLLPRLWYGGYKNVMEPVSEVHGGGRISTNPLRAGKTFHVPQGILQSLLEDASKRCRPTFSGPKSLDSSFFRVDAIVGRIER